MTPLMFHYRDPSDILSSALFERHLKLVITMRGHVIATSVLVGVGSVIHFQDPLCEYVCLVADMLNR